MLRIRRLVHFANLTLVEIAQSGLRGKFTKRHIVRSACGEPLRGYFTLE
jgi:hypothetical protein